MTLVVVLHVVIDTTLFSKLYSRAVIKDPGISIATVYRTVKLFEEAGILDRVEFNDGRSRYEDAERDHHDHLIDLQTGEILEFFDDEIEKLQEKISEKFGYKLLGHKLELYGIKLENTDENTNDSN